jgi:hypothetical protein
MVLGGLVAQADDLRARGFRLQQGVVDDGRECGGGGEGVGCEGNGVESGGVSDGKRSRGVPLSLVDAPAGPRTARYFLS